ANRARLTFPIWNTRNDGFDSSHYPELVDQWTSNLPTVAPIANPNLAGPGTQLSQCLLQCIVCAANRPCWQEPLRVLQCNSVCRSSMPYAGPSQTPEPCVSG